MLDAKYFSKRKWFRGADVSMVGVKTRLTWIWFFAALALPSAMADAQKHGPSPAAELVRRAKALAKERESLISSLEKAARIAIKNSDHKNERDLLVSLGNLKAVGSIGFLYENLGVEFPKKSQDDPDVIRIRPWAESKPAVAALIRIGPIATRALLNHIATDPDPSKAQAAGVGIFLGHFYGRKAEKVLNRYLNGIKKQVERERLINRDLFRFIANNSEKGENDGKGNKMNSGK